MINLNSYKWNQYILIEIHSLFPNYIWKCFTKTVQIFVFTFNDVKLCKFFFAWSKINSSIFSAEKIYLCLHKRVNYIRKNSTRLETFIESWLRHSSEKKKYYPYFHIIFANLCLSSKMRYNMFIDKEKFYTAAQYFHCTFSNSIWWHHTKYKR